MRKEFIKNTIDHILFFDGDTDTKKVLEFVP